MHQSGILYRLFKCLSSQCPVRAVTKRLLAGLLAGAEIFRAGFRGCPLHGRIQALGLVAAITEGLGFRLSAGAPPIVFAAFNLDSDGFTACDVWLRHDALPPDVWLHASQQAFASSRTRAI